MTHVILSCIRFVHVSLAPYSRFDAVGSGAEDDAMENDEIPSPINRELQRELLLLLRSKYPRTLIDIPIISDVSQQSIYTNLWYLQEHGLCDSGLSPHLDGCFTWGGATITAKGLDFLEEDGGLSSLLGIVTIKIHADTLREMLRTKIDDAPLTPDEKSTLKQKLEHLSETALTAGTRDLVQIGLQHVPNFVEWLRTFFGP